MLYPVPFTYLDFLADEVLFVFPPKSGTGDLFGPSDVLDVT
jgi:hypothetical protein